MDHTTTVPGSTIAAVADRSDDERPMLSAIDATVDIAAGPRLLQGVDIAIHAGELVVVVGPSGSGKTTLLETLAGIRPTSSGRIDVRADAGPLGYVPQEDIVHRDLTVASSVGYAARLRLPGATTTADIEGSVDRTLRRLGLTDRRDVAVSALSGGQRKRASIATELVARPSVCLLDEPTAGLDPEAAASLMDVLRDLADAGTAILMTTHNLADLHVADRLVVMSAGGTVAFDGSPSDGAEYLTSGRHTSVVPATVGRHRDVVRSPEVGVARAGAEVPVHGWQRPSRWQQCAVLARRNLELLRRNRMSLAIMAGSPVLIVAMFVMLFPSGAFDATAADPTVAIAIVYWLAFAGFFFGLTFGLLQICTELPIVRRERLAVIDLGPYLVAKAAILVPILGTTNLVMICTLTAFDRLPGLGVADAITLWSLLGLDALVGLALGMLASASVTGTAQAALALPMLCFPAVLFSGAVLPVAAMAAVGRAIAAVTSDRWAFEALARTLHVASVPFDAPGRHAVDLHGGALSGPITLHVVVMAVLAVAFGLSTRLVLERRAR